MSRANLWRSTAALEAVLILASCGASAPPAGAFRPRARQPAPSSTPSRFSDGKSHHQPASNVPPRPLKAGAVASFRGLRKRLRGKGKVALALEPLGAGRLIDLGGDPAMQGMSTTKVLILAALLRDVGGVKHLTARERALAHSAITRSDNAAILDLFRKLEADRGGLARASAYATQLLRDAGDTRTTVTTAPPPPGYATTFGQTPWRPSAEVRFFRYLALGCLLPRRDTRYVFSLMRRIEPSESWGLGSAGFRSVAFKGGWGPEPGGRYGVRQTAIIGHGERAVVAAITADPTTSFPTGTRILTTVARWLHSHLLIRRRPLPSCSAARRANP